MKPLTYILAVLLTCGAAIGSELSIILNAIVNGAINPEFYVTADLTLNGDGSTVAMDTNGATGADTFSYTPPEGYDFIAFRALIYLEDAVAFDFDTFGAVAQLGNGVQIWVDTTLLATWNDNRDIGLDMFDISGAAALFTKADKAMMCRWSFFKATSNRGLVISDTKSFLAIIRDDITGLDVFNIRVQGFLRVAE